jgi:DNA-binding transcriptional LysR family regulator
MLTPLDLELFVAIADTGSLTAAARACGVTRATIARRLEALEERLGVALISRTTRDLLLTEAGAVYLEGCRETLMRHRQAEAAVHELGGKPRGRLRIAGPIIGVEQIVGPLLTSFAQQYPEVDVQVSLSSEPCNPLVDSCDIAVQLGFEKNSALIAQRLLRETYTLVASPDYLKRRGVPLSVDELAHHDCIVAARTSGVHESWPLRDAGVVTVTRPRFLANAPGLIRMSALQGLGIALMAHFLVRDDIASGALVRVLGDQVGQELPVCLVYAAGSRRSPKIRCFIDYASTWVERLANPAAPVAGILAGAATASARPHG